MSEYTAQEWQQDGTTVYALNIEGTNRFSAQVQGGWATDGRLRTDATELEANARLIAAAPELLEALVWMVENDETNEGDAPVDDLGGESWNEYNAYWIAGLNRARAAIAKATGEPQ